MTRNICIFSDGTGQAAATIDHWTNVYKLYKHTRDADPAIRSASTIRGWAPSPMAKSRGWPGGAQPVAGTGYGITPTSIDCYTALLLRLPAGDQVACSASAGAPIPCAASLRHRPVRRAARLPKLSHWGELQRSLEHEVRAIAEAVKTVYQERDETKRTRRGGVSATSMARTMLPPTLSASSTRCGRSRQGHRTGFTLPAQLQQQSS